MSDEELRQLEQLLDRYWAILPAGPVCEAAERVRADVLSRLGVRASVRIISERIIQNGVSHD